MRLDRQLARESRSPSFRPLSCLFVILMLTTGCDNYQCRSEDLTRVPKIFVANRTSVELGGGMIAPYRMMWTGAPNDPLFALTGRGETFSEGFLHALDPDTFLDVADPIDIGINGADLVATPSHIFVVARGSQSLLSIDKTNWQVVSQLKLEFVPVSIVLINEDTVAVASATDGTVAFIKFVDAKLQLIDRIDLQTFTGTMIADATRLFVIQPLSGVTILDKSDFRKINGPITLPGEPTRGAILWKQYLVVSAREGFLHFLDLTDNTLSSLDIADVLGLDRISLPARAIDSGALITVADGRFILVNGRRDSIVFDFDGQMTPPVRAVAMVPGGANATYVPESNIVYLTQPSINAVVTVQLMPLDGTRLTGIRTITGSELVDTTIPRDATSSVATLDSTGRLRVLDRSGVVELEIASQPGESWRSPLTSAPNGGFTTIARKTSGAEFLVHLDRSGIEIARYAVEINAIFSGAEDDGQVLLISRLNQTLQLTDVLTGSTEVLQLDRDRPRFAAYLGSNKWAIIHDTNPDIGISLLDDRRIARFERFNDWYSDIVATEPGRAMAASFNGSLSTIDDQGQATRRICTGVGSASDIEIGMNDSVWLSSENNNVAYQVFGSSRSPAASYSERGLKSLAAIPGTSSLIATTARSVVYLDIQP